jgi:hypothetical protein
MTIHVQHFSSYNFEGLENLSSQHEEEINEGMREQEDEANPDGDFNFAQLGLFTESSKDDMSGIIDQNPQANPEGKFDFAALGKYTESSNDDSADNINQEVADQEVQDNHAFQEVQDTQILMLILLLLAETQILPVMRKVNLSMWSIPNQTTSLTSELGLLFVASLIQTTFFMEKLPTLMMTVRCIGWNLMRETMLSLKNTPKISF